MEKGKGYGKNNVTEKSVIKQVAIGYNFHSEEKYKSYEPIGEKDEASI